MKEQISVVLSHQVCGDLLELSKEMNSAIPFRMKSQTFCLSLQTQRLLLTSGPLLGCSLSRQCSSPDSLSPSQSCQLLHIPSHSSCTNVTSYPNNPPPCHPHSLSPNIPCSIFSPGTTEYTCGLTSRCPFPWEAKPSEGRNLCNIRPTIFPAHATTLGTE